MLVKPQASLHCDFCESPTQSQFRQVLLLVRGSGRTVPSAQHYGWSTTGHPRQGVSDSNDVNEPSHLPECQGPATSMVQSGRVDTALRDTRKTDTPSTQNPQSEDEEAEQIVPAARVGI